MNGGWLGVSSDRGVACALRGGGCSTGDRVGVLPCVPEGSPVNPLWLLAGLACSMAAVVIAHGCRMKLYRLVLRLMMGW